jgi:hypothetical protein
MPVALDVSARLGTEKHLEGCQPRSTIVNNIERGWCPALKLKQNMDGTYPSFPMAVNQQLPKIMRSGN